MSRKCTNGIVQGYLKYITVLNLAIDMIDIRLQNVALAHTTFLESDFLITLPYKPIHFNDLWRIASKVLCKQARYNSGMLIFFFIGTDIGNKWWNISKWFCEI